MKLEFLFPGKVKEPYLQEGIDDYCARLRRLVPLQVKAIKIAPQRKLGDDQYRAYESGRLEENISPGGYRVLLDGRGRRFTSESFAALIGDLEVSAVRTVSFMIGGPLGLDEQLCRRADVLLSLSDMTFTHDMVRLILLEQVYRAYQINGGTRYHK